MLNMVEQLCKFRLDNIESVHDINVNSTVRQENAAGVQPSRGPRFINRALSQRAAVSLLSKWYPSKETVIGTISKWMRLVNCDNAIYFFERLGEPAWGAVRFTQTEMTKDFAGMC